MPPLSAHHSGSLVKVLYIGDSGTGKTGSLVSLVKAGYKLRILDFDNGLDILKSYIMQECPDKIANVEYETFRDKYKPTQTGPTILGIPKAYIDCLKALDKWPASGAPLEQSGPDTIVVLDSLTYLGRAAFNWAKAMNPTYKDPRLWYGDAQQAVDVILSNLNADSFSTNVIVTAHVKIQTAADGSMRGFPHSIGKAQDTFIGSHFNNMFLATKDAAGKRKISTVPTNLVDLKSSAPFKVDKYVELETGLAKLFDQLKGK